MVGAAAALAGLCRAAVGNDGGALDRYEQSQVHMATIVKVVVYAPSPAAATAATEAAFARVKELNAILSDYVDDSELNRFVKASPGTKVKLSPELFTVLERARQWHDQTDGCFDVTAGPVIRLWRSARRTKRLPSTMQIDEALSRVGAEKLILDPKDRTGQLTHRNMRIDLGGIAKGYVGDEMLKTLASHRLNRAMIVLGGDVVCGDPPPSQKGWRVAVVEPTTANVAAADKQVAAAPLATLLLANAAASTSGDAYQYAEIGGRRFSHIIDPKTGRAQTGRRQTTVVACTGMDADALATAATVMGVERGKDLIQKQGVAGLFVSVDDAGRLNETSTTGWSDFTK
jgi:thiamine biosynthesis lipoprotein